MDGSWNSQLIRNLFSEEDAFHILEIAWPTIACNDKLIWFSNNSGKFSVGECYKLNFIDSSLLGVSAV